MDRITPQRRSWNMGRIKSRNTDPEIAVRSLLWRMGFRYRLHGTDLPGHPDIVLPRYGTVVLVHGCFWHRHRNCRFAYMPKSRAEFWTSKFAANVLRDRRMSERLRRDGWRVLVVWECQLRRPASVSARIGRLLRGREAVKHIVKGKAVP
jgi:DNA mismatch endonuclease (patch repair protein)